MLDVSGFPPVSSSRLPIQLKDSLMPMTRITVKTLALFIAVGLTGIAHAYGGSIVGWGSNSDDQLADIPTGSDYTTVASNYANVYALTTSGSIAAWGYDSWGQVSNTPTGLGFQSIAAGELNAFALAADGSIAAWGDSTYGLLDVPTGNDFVAIAAGNYSAYALRLDGSIAAWGYDGDMEVTGTPSSGVYSAVAGGYAAGFAITAAAVPEPSTYAMALAGLACGGYSLFRRRRAR